VLPSWYEVVLESDVFNAIFFVLPAAIANTTPVLFGGGLPMDFRRNWFDNRRILGDNKTIRGFIVGFVAGFLLGLFTKWWLEQKIGVSFAIPYTNGFLQGLGVVVGDVVGSFIKRRLKIPSGGPLVVMDQIGFIVFGLAFARIDTAYPPIFWLITVPLALVVHFAANAISYTLGWKDVWW
jgi:CDP-2,3-bis-(O-geranylgeranyl)-sn-glycerol synthase